MSRNLALDSRRSSISDGGSHLQDRRVSITTSGDTHGTRRPSICSITGPPNLTKRRSTIHRKSSLLDNHPAQLAFRPRLANTYQMEPERKFKPTEIQKLVYNVLEERLEDTSYDPDKCRFLVVSLANEIRHRVKQMGFARYKIVCTVDMGSIAEQGLRVASRCLWDKVQDSLGTATYKNESLFAVGTVFGVYHE
ncbi:tctex1 domain-containing protein 1-B-like [Dendronephthya gigantea]|uniref:tctex1 domain-containing protein 1-B-like n=1 Tax=Dendronephthya gigantea TaxID=151771 RepID=UPI001069D1A5|nr:tctex1 domain-containing protein 1-B-like [Dendronephthya gigantea]